MLAVMTNQDWAFVVAFILFVVAFILSLVPPFKNVVIAIISAGLAIFAIAFVINP